MLKALSGIPKLVLSSVSSILVLTSIIISMITFMSPTLILHGSVSLLSVVPSTALQPNVSGKTVDGASLWVGILGSCSRVNNAASFKCTTPAVNPVYDVSALPSNAPAVLINTPPSATPVFVGMGIVSSFIFFALFALMSFRNSMAKPNLHRFTTCIGFFGFMITMTAYLILRMWFGKAVQDFNSSVIQQGAQGPNVIASIGNGFTMIWVASAFSGLPVIVCLTKLTITKPKF